MKLDTRIREFMAPVRVLMAEGVENAEILLREADQIGLNERYLQKYRVKRVFFWISERNCMVLCVL